MNRPFREIRRPVERENASSYLLLALLSFAASVVGTRLFLELTGYPQIGNSELHIAHVLWGGLLLFIAALLPLMLANRWVFPAGAIFGGAGVGLFIDEVGKFITQSNDYFYPLAAPIIYAFFLLTALLYIQVRRPTYRDFRTELYYALDRLLEVLDHDLSARERDDLAARLRRVRDNALYPEHARLAGTLYDFIMSDAVQICPEYPPLWQRALDRLRTFEERWISRNRYRIALAIGLGALSVVALIGLIIAFLALTTPQILETMAVQLISSGAVRSATGFSWFVVWTFLDGAVGAMLFVAGALMLGGRDRLGTRLGFLGLVLALTVVNLLAFYFNQFATVTAATAQFALLLAIIHYRFRFFAVMGMEKRPNEMVGGKMASSDG